jgi:hypothetical protein
MIRTARGLSELGPRRGDLGTAARAAGRTAAGSGTGLERRTGGQPPVDLPWGTGPRAPASDAAVTGFANPALAAYAELLRRRRGADRAPDLRGLPLLARRRGGTALGATAGPGGLAGVCIPTDAAVPAEVTRAMRPEAPARATGAPVPLAPVPAPTRRGGR